MYGAFDTAVQPDLPVETVPACCSTKPGAGLDQLITVFGGWTPMESNGDVKFWKAFGTLV